MEEMINNIEEDVKEEYKEVIRKTSGEKFVNVFMIMVVGFAIVILFFTAKNLFFNIDEEINVNQQGANSMQRLSRMSLTSYDKEQARQMMDKDGDGMCNVCGMDVNICIESGQMQCNMGSETTIGVLQSQHIHADWKIYINDKPYDFISVGDRHERQMRGDPSIQDTSAFIHIHPAASPEKTGDVLHMHATGVPLWIFFDSLDLKLPTEMKAYVNGKEISYYKDYVFEDLDKILITDGKGDLQEQIGSVTDFAKNH